MKIKIIAPILIAAAQLSLGAVTDVPKIELRAESMVVVGETTVAKGSAVAIVGDIKIAAEQITVDQVSGELKCLGETIITGVQVTIRTRDAKIDTKPARSPIAPLPLRKIRDLPTLDSRF